jgi:hypothetical protein
VDGQSQSTRASRSADSKFEFEPEIAPGEGRARGNFERCAPSNRDAEGWDGARAPRDHQSKKQKPLSDGSFVEAEAFMQRAHGKLRVLSRNNAANLDLAGADGLNIDAFAGENAEHLGGHAGV